MLMLIDSANLEEIQKLYETFPVDGVTTNPSILKKENENPLAVLKKIKTFLPKGAQLHVQTLSQTTTEIIKEAFFILDQLGDETYIKIPVFPSGIKAISLLSNQGINTTATAIYSPMQAFIAAKAGADWVAPYLNRLDNIGADGVQVTKDIHDILVKHGTKAKVLAASFKNTQQILSLCRYGVASITAAPTVIEQLVKHQITESAIADFTKDFEELCGEGKTMMNLDC